mmetsp:Transcript_37812/g.92023  ORF Transcript_37812/g.92023 Transcript_37812/m.92023 type:complete len:203 (+) Transcript_37812:102-710(+)
MTTPEEEIAVKMVEKPGATAAVGGGGDGYVQYGDATSDDDGQKTTKKRGHICCGCCCDTRMAVIVMNIINIIMVTMGLISLSLLATNKVQAQYDDDEVQSALNQIDGTVLGVSIGYGVVAMACNSVAIYGATKYKGMPVVVGTVWFVVECIRSLVFLNLGGAIFAGLAAYPHWILYREIQNGIMSPQTYQNEKSCCECSCCV